MTKDNLLIYVCATGGQAPEWIQILPLGKVELRDSREPFEVTRADLDKIISKFKADGLDLVVDYEHQSLGGDKAPAAGWMKDLQARPDGLYAKVEWTAEGRRLIESQEYRYYSPVLKLEPKTRRPLALMHAALTNTPAMTKLAPLLAAKYGEEGDVLVLAAADPAKAAQEARAKQYGIGIKAGGNVTKPGQWAQVPDAQFADPVNYRYPMPDHDQCLAAWDYWNHPKNQEQYTPEERASIEKRIKSRAKAVGMQIQEAKPMKNKVIGLLALKADATDDEVLAALEANLKLTGALPEIAVALGLEKTATPGQINGAILALKQGQDQLATLHTEVAALKTESAKTKAAAAVDEALNTGKIQPTQKDWALEYAARDLEGFKVYVEKAPKVVPVGDHFTLPKEKDGDGALSADDRTLCKSLGITAEAFKAQRAAEQAAKEGR